MCILSFHTDKYDVTLRSENIIEKPVHKFDPVSELGKKNQVYSVKMLCRRKINSNVKKAKCYTGKLLYR